MKKILLFCLILSSVSFTFSQSITNYAFTASSGTYTAITGGTQAVGNNDDGGSSGNINIGFDFYYMGVRHTKFGVSAEGLMNLGTSTTFSSNNNLDFPQTAPKIAPLWDDLKTGANGSVSYVVTGTHPNKVLTAQWHKMRWNWNAGSDAISFQVKLYETTGVIEYIYFQEAGAVAGASASIGLTEDINDEFISLNGTGSNPTASFITETANLATKPATGQIYRFSPVTTVAPTNLTFECITKTSMSLKWTNNTDTKRLNNLIYRSTDNVDFTFVASVGKNVATYSATGLTASTDYYWKVNAGSEGYLNPVAKAQRTQGLIATTSKSTICKDETVDLAVTDYQGAIKWQSSPNGTAWADIAGATTANYTTAPITATTYYRAVATTGVCTENSNTLTVTVNPTGGTITASVNPVCTGGTATLTLAGSTGTIQWQRSSDSTTFTTVGGVTANHTSTPILTKSFFRTKLSNGTCADEFSNILKIDTMNAPPIPGKITGERFPCTGTYTYSVVPVYGATTYTWAVPGVGYTIQTGQGTNTITVLIGGFAGAGEITISAGNTCGTSTTNSLTITPRTQAPTAPTAITGPASVCSATTQTYATSAANAATFNWTVPGGSTISSGQGTDTIKVLFGITSGDISVTATNGCGTSPATTLAIAITPSVVPDVSIAVTTGSNPTCQGTNVGFTATPVNGGPTPTYQWQVNGGNVGTDIATYASSGFNNTDLVRCILTSNATCATPPKDTSNVITLTVNPNVVPSISIALITGTNPSCVGSALTFTATPTNGGTPTYDWKVNGGSVGTGSSFSSSTLANNDIVSCVMTSTAACASPTTANSNTITLTRNAIVTPTVSIAITSGSNPTCTGSSVTFTATPNNGGTSPTYDWTLNGLSVATTATYTTSALVTNDEVSCIMTSNATCISSPTANSDKITMTVNPSVTPSVTIAITSGGNPTCQGATVTFTSTPTNGGASPTYDWKVNNLSVASGTTYSSSTFVDGDKVSCVLTSDNPCANPTKATSSEITISVTPLATPSVSIAITSGSNPSCAGTSVTFTATPTNGGSSPSYSWKINGTTTSTGATFTSTSLLNNDQVTCEMTSNIACPSTPTVTSNTIAMTINPVLVPVVSIAITTGTNPMCEGATTTFTATPTNGGISPSYSWTLNGGSVSINSTYTSSTLENNDVIVCAITSNATCANPTTANSNEITMVVNSNNTPTVVIAISSGNNPTCTGENMTFTATPTNGGSNPLFDWKLNGTSIETGATYSTTTLVTDDEVSCVLTSNAACASPATVSSNEITIAIAASVTPEISISVTSGNNPSCTGSSVTFTADPTNGGNTPSYEWLLNGNPVGTSSTYTSSSLTTGDKVECNLVSSSGCASPTSASSNEIIMTVNSIVTPSISIAITSGSNPSCDGSTVTFTATPTNGGTTPTYSWTLNGTAVGTGTTYSSSTLINGDNIYCVLTSNHPCKSIATANSNGIEMTVNPLLTPTIVIELSSGSNPTCEGLSVTFTASSTNGGSAPTYDWQVNGISVETGVSFTSSTLTNNDVVSSIMTSNEICVTSSTATSNSITLVVNPSVTPSISIAIVSGTNPMCEGSAITFEATPTNGGSTPAYDWQVNSISVGTTSTYNSSSLQNNDVVTCLLTSSETCANPMNIVSNEIILEVNPVLTPAVTIDITSGDNPTCAGESITFTATPTAGGSAPTYIWKVNGIAVGTEETYTGTSWNNNDAVSCEMTSNADCISGTNATSNTTTITLSGTLTPTLSILISNGSNPSCEGSSITFSTDFTNGGTTPTFEWFLNELSVGTDPTYTAVLQENDVIGCVMTSSSACASPTKASAQDITVATKSIETPTLSIAVTTGNNPSCSGETVEFTATTTYGGSNPQFDWFVNGNSSGTSYTYTSNSLADGDLVACVLTSNETCTSSATANSNDITMVVGTTVSPTVFIAITSGANETCEGEEIEFTATPTNEGSTPNYQWQVNGSDVGTGISYTTSTSTDGDEVTCILTSSATCANPTTVTSYPITLIVYSSLSPIVQIDITSGNDTICDGTPVTFTATPTNGGATPTYEWKVNGSLTGSGLTFVTSTLSQSDIVSCALTSSSFCATPQTVESNTIPITVYDIPATPVIAQNNLVLSSNALTGNQWYQNSTLIPSEVNQTLTVTTNGTYHVTVTLTGCSSNPSNPVYIGNVSLTEHTGLEVITVSPNPSTGIFNIKKPESLQNSILSIRIYNTLGELVQEIPDSSEELKIDLRDVVTGVYLLKIESQHGIYTQRLIKQ
jgi:hypothetical protein